MAFFTLHIQEDSCDPARDVVPAEDFVHCLEAFVDDVSCTHAGAAKHVVLILVLEAAARAQSVRCAPADLFLLMLDVQPLVHHLGHADGRGVRESALARLIALKFMLSVSLFLHSYLSCR